MKTEIEPFYQKKRRIIARRFCGLPRNAGKREGHRCGGRSTPDHQHAHGILIAMRMGKPVYGEKPLIPNIREARLVAKAANETGVATQMGPLGHTRGFMADTMNWGSRKRSPC